MLQKFRKAFAFLFIRRSYRKPFEVTLDQAIVSFTFDDVPLSALTSGLDILTKYGYPCTFYMAFDLMNQEKTDLRANNELLLQKIRNAGCEIACHTYSHLHFFRSNENEINSDLDNNQSFVRKLIPGYSLTNFSFPYGEQTARARRIIRKRFRTARSVYKGLNDGIIDLNCLKAVRLYESIHINKAKEMVDLAIDRKAWLIFYTHDVSDTPSENGCSPAYFEEIIKYCSGKNLKVLTIEQAADLLCQKKQNNLSQ